MPIGTITGSGYGLAAGPNVTERDCDVPAGTADGDVLLAYAVLTQDDVSATAISSTDWDATQFPRETPAGIPAIGLSAVLKRVWNTGDPTTFTFTKNGTFGAGSFGVVMIKVPGADSAYSVAPMATPQANTDATVECPAATVPAGLPSDGVVIRFYHLYYYMATKGGTAVWTPPTNFTEQADASDEWLSMGAATRIRTSGAEAIGAATAAGSAGAPGRGISLVLAPAVAATGSEPGRRLLLGVS